MKTFEEQKIEFEQKKYLGERFQRYFDLYSNQLFIHNILITGFNLYTMQKSINHNVLEIMLGLAIISGVISAIFLLYDYRLTYELLNGSMYQEDAEVQNNKARYYGKWAWRLFCIGTGISLLNILCSLIK